ncbi:MAG: citrate synthase [Bernardetiaceae bacterium]|jgi:citrate synthase|nr:citrate synthase [Bernardetiaceae bacterium]
MSKHAELHYEGKVYKLPVIEGTEHETALDISKLRDETGLITLDIGYKNTGATQSAITFLDGEEGILRYRGYGIEDLAEHADFLEVAHLLIYGELPNKATLDKFERDISRRTLVHEDIRKIFDGFPANAHPMGVLSSLVCSLTAFYPGHRTVEEMDLTIVRLLAKLPTLAAWSYRNGMGHPLNYPNNNLNYCANFLHMMFAYPTEDYEVNPVVVDALDKLLILHADHEQNCSTSTVRIVGSSQVGLFSAVAAGINALWGPLHGGANQEVIEMLERIKADGGNVKKYVDMAKDKNSGFRLMGFGHRVYKNFDPRAKIIKKACDNVLAALKIDDPALNIARQLEEYALKDEYFISRKLYPNVDFYSGIIYRALGIPTNMFTVMFALGRLPGWIAQWREMVLAKEPIGRPRQVFVGKPHRPFVPLASRA